MRRVVVTGMGAVTPVGLTADDTFAALVAGRSGVGPLTRFDASTFPTRIAAEVKGYDPAARDPGARWWRKAWLNTWFAVTATAEAVRQAGLEGGRFDPTRAGVYLGGGEGEQYFVRMLTNLGESFDPATGRIDGAAYLGRALERYDPAELHEQDVHVPAARVAEVFGLEGPNLSCLTACAAGTQALGEAFDLVRRGDADVMVAGGSHSIIHPTAMTGFCRLTAMTTRNDDPTGASRPFDRTRDGFVPGEGAGILVLEDLAHARARGAEILAEVTGYGITADAYRATDPHPDGRGAAGCMRAALADARLDPAAVEYVSAHGTGTPANDRAETRALKTVFGPRAGRLPASSVKSMIGHLIGAAGSVEAIACVLAVRRGVVPPTINLHHPDPECDLDYVPHAAREVRVRHALNNSFGFGGVNAALVVSRFGG